MTTYDVTFNTVDGKSLIKRNVQSDHENARVSQHIAHLERDYGVPLFALI